MELKLNYLPEKYESIIIPLMTMSDKLVLGGSLALHILDIMDYDFDKRKPDIDFSLREPLTEHELSVIKDFYGLTFITRHNDYTTSINSYNDISKEQLRKGIEEIEKLNPKPVKHFLNKDIIQLFKPNLNTQADGTEHWDKEYIIDFFNSTYLPKKELVIIDYKGYELRLSHPSYILSHKSKYAYDSRVGKQYKHFQDLEKIDWKKYFTIVKRIEPKFSNYIDEEGGYRYVFTNNTWSPIDIDKQFVDSLTF